MISPISDVTMRSLLVALQGLDARQQTIAANVANVETPNYRAVSIDFETSLRAALEGGGEPTRADFVVDTSDAPTRLNGNNVALDREMIAQSETLLRTQLVVGALNNKYSMLRTAITGQ